MLIKVCNWFFFGHWNDVRVLPGGGNLFVLKQKLTKNLQTVTMWF